MNLPRRVPLTLLAAAAIAALPAAAGCGFDTSAGDGGGAAEPETAGITLYSGRIPAAIGGAVDRYEARADRDVQVRYADTADLAATLVEEGGATPADVFFAQEPGAIGAVADAGLLAKLPAAVLDLVPRRYRDPRGRWVGVTGRARVIAYDRGAVRRSQLPRSPFGLAAPRWRDRVGWSPASSSMQEYVTALRARYGNQRTSEWLEAMVANGAKSYPNNVTIRDAIAAGEIEAGLINHYYVAQAVAEEGADYPVGVYFPPAGLGSLMLLTTVGVLEASERRPEAVAFVRSLLESASQRFFTSSSKEYPLARGAEPDASLGVPLARVPSPGGDLVDLGELQATIELMQEAGAL
jgi:iron(III) transport system substrate-binding protein